MSRHPPYLLSGITLRNRYLSSGKKITSETKFVKPKCFLEGSFLACYTGRVSEQYGA
jgi:hypothetical protein